MVMLRDVEQKIHTINKLDAIAPPSGVHHPQGKCLIHTGRISRQLVKNMKHTVANTPSRIPVAVVTCPAPENIDMGFLSSNEERDYDYKETVRYGCNEDYVLDGNFQIVCNQDGNWSKKPSCKGRAATDNTVTVRYKFWVWPKFLGDIDR